MSKLVNPIFHSSPIPKLTKTFVYKSENFKVDFDLLKRNCKYFQDHEQEINDEYEMKEIKDFPIETIRTFLNCCQNQTTEIKDIVGINYLSIKYENEELQKFTDKYIEENSKGLVFQMLSFKCQILNLIDEQHKDAEFNINTVKEEEILSKSFLDYIEDERIFTVPIHIVKRAMKKFLDNNKEINNDQASWKKIKDFLLRCLNEYNTEASILFSDINFGKFDRDLIVSLHNSYSEKFDINMLNPKSLFDVTYDLISEVSQIKSQMNLIHQEHLSEMNALNEFKKKIEQELNEIRGQQQIMSQNKEFEVKLQSIEEKQNSYSDRIKNLENNKNENDQKHNNSILKIQELENKNRNIENKLQELNNLSGRVETIENKQSTTESKISNFVTKEI